MLKEYIDLCWISIAKERSLSVVVIASFESHDANSSPKYGPHPLQNQFNEVFSEGESHHLSVNVERAFFSLFKRPRNEA